MNVSGCVGWAVDQLSKILSFAERSTKLIPPMMMIVFEDPLLIGI